MTEPLQKPGRSIQVVGTPWPLIRSVERLIDGKFAVDLAAEEGNRKAEKWYGPGSPLHTDSLAWDCRWRDEKAGWLWLNPPFGKIQPWAVKCVVESKYGARIVMLTPASIGSVWFQKIVYPNAWVIAISPRITFLGHSIPFPKDCILSIFTPEMKRANSLSCWTYQG
jgi:hypothetical protein